MEKKSKPICYGSLITLKTTEEYNLAAQGFIDNSPYLQREIFHHFNLAVFRIIPQSIYSVQNEILDYTRDIKDNSFMEKVEKLSKLEDSLEGEIKTNMQNYSILKGQPIKYDSLIQLVHVQSHKFLALERNETSEIEKENLKVSLEDFPSEYSHFKILPGYVFQKYTDGVVQSTDKLYLEILIPELRRSGYLHSSSIHNNELFMSRINSLLDSTNKISNYLEVNISLDQKTRWMVSEFSESVQDDPYLSCGDYIWITKSEDGISLAVNKKKKKGLMFTPNASDINGMWMLENSDCAKGGFVEIGACYRLKHISTGSYLFINDDFTPGLSEETCEGTLWVFLPLESECKYLLIDEMCFLINKKTRLTLSLENNNYQIVSIPCNNTITSINEETVYKITKAGEEVVWETLFLLHCYPILWGFTQFLIHDQLFIGPDGYKAIHEFKKKADLIETCISKLIQFCNNKLQGMIGIDNHYGEVQLIRQRMLKDQGFFEVLGNILENALKFPIEYDKILGVISQREKILKKIQKGAIDLELVRLKHIIRIIEKIYSLLLTLCHKNHENQLYAYHFFPIYMIHVGLDLGANEFILSVLKDNEQLLLSINNPQSLDGNIDIIESFGSLLQKDKKDINIKLLDFLKSICIYKGQGVTANQEKVYKCIIKNHQISQEVLTKTIIEKYKLCIVIDNVNIPIESCFESGRIAVYFTDIIYFTKILELYANMCVGRNFEVSGDLTAQFPLDKIHYLMWNLELTDEIRAAFCKMLLNLYIDCSPKEEVIKPQLIKEFKATDCRYSELSSHRTATISFDRRRDYIKVSDSSGESLFMYPDKPDNSDSSPLSADDKDIYKVLKNIFRYFETNPVSTELTCEILRLTFKLVKFEWFGVHSTDFKNKRIIKNPAYPENELDIVRVLKAILPLLFVGAKKPALSNMPKRKRSIKLEYKPSKQNSEKDFVYLSSLLQDSTNLKDPLIRSAANLKNYIASYKQNPLNGVEKKSTENRIKQKITRILNYYLNTRQEFLLNNIVAWYNSLENKPAYQNLDILNLLPKVMKFATNVEKYKQYSSKVFDSCFMCVKGPVIPDINTLTCEPIIPKLLKAFVYNDSYKLQTFLLEIIIRSYEQRKELLKYVSMLHPVSSQQDIDLLKWLKFNIITFKTYSEQSELWVTYWERPEEQKKDHFHVFKEVISILNSFQDFLYEDTSIDKDILIVNQKKIISASRQKIMNYLDVDRLVLALIKDSIHELVKLNAGRRHSGKKRNLTELFELCFSFLEKFTTGNPQNQKRLYKSLHIFMQNLNIDLGQISLICQIFKNNLKLIEKVDQEFLIVFKNLIVKYGRRPLFLKFLMAIQTFKDKAVPSTQRIILNMFVKEDLDLFLLYMGDKVDQEFSFERAFDENPEYFDEPYEYHAALLNVLSNCGYGATGVYFNEAKCQNIIKLNNIFGILFNAEDKNSPFFKLKVPTMNFFYNIYVDTEIINPELKTYNNFFEYIYLQSKVLEETELIDPDYLDFLTIFTKTLLKYRSSYIKKTDNFYYDHKDSQAICAFIESLIENKEKFKIKGITNAFLQSASELCDSFGFNFDQEVDEADIMFETQDFNKRAASYKDIEDKVTGSWNQIRMFMIYDGKLKEKIEEEQQALLLSIHFSNELSPDISFEKILKALVNFIRLSRSQQPPLALTLSAIELLTCILAHPIHDKYTEPAEAKRALQITMSGYGVVRVVLTLMCDSNVEIQIFKALMIVCIELLDGGNETVQNEIYIYFKNTLNSEIFFERINQMFSDYMDKCAHGQVLAVKRTKVFKRKYDVIKSLLRLLQLFCENHNLELQNYIRYQNKSRNSYNMIENTINLLEILIDKKLFISFPVISQCLDTLTEFIQGPCMKNQEYVIDGKFLELACTLLSLDEKSGTAEVYKFIKKTEYADTVSDTLSPEEEETLYLTGWMVAHLKYKCMITILSLLEGRKDDYVLTRLIRTFNIEILKENLKSIYMSYVKQYSSKYYDNDIFNHIKDNENYVFGSNDNEQDKNSGFYSLVIETGFMIYQLIKIFMESEDPESQEIIAGELEQLQKYKELGELNKHSKHNIKSVEFSDEAINQAILNYNYFRSIDELENSQTILLNSAFNFFDKYTGKIEVMFNGNLFRVYFPLPADFRGITQEIKENFHRKVNRDTDQTKLKYMLKNVEDLIEQINHEHYLLNAMQNSKVISLVASKVYIWRDIAFAITIIINTVVLLSYSQFNELDRMWDIALFNYRFDANHLDIYTTFVIIRVLGVTQLVCCIIIVAFFLLKVGPIVTRRGWEKNKPTLEFLRSNPNILKRTVLTLKQFIWTIIYIFIDFHVPYHIAYTIFSVLGIFAHPFYFSLLLLDILYKYPSLQNVVKSFTVPRKALLMTFLLMIVIMYLFAIIGYIYFQGDFNNDCRTLYWCTIILWDASFKNNGMIGGFMAQFDDGDLHIDRFFYDNVFNILLDVIIIGVVEGLIVDTFAMLREKQEKSNNDRETKCFICGLERDFIERKTNLPFAHHTEIDHNEWNYIFFLAYLIRKVETEYSGLESYVRDQYDRGEFTWIPNRQTMSIKDFEYPEEAESIQTINNIEIRLKKIENQIKNLQNTQKIE